MDVIGAREDQARERRARKSANLGPRVVPGTFLGELGLKSDTVDPTAILTALAIKLKSSMEEIIKVANAIRKYDNHAVGVLVMLGMSPGEKGANALRISEWISKVEVAAAGAEAAPELNIDPSRQEPMAREFIRLVGPFALDTSFQTNETSGQIGSYHFSNPSNRHVKTHTSIYKAAVVYNWNSKLCPKAATYVPLRAIINPEDFVADLITRTKWVPFWNLGIRRQSLASLVNPKNCEVIYYAMQDNPFTSMTPVEFFGPEERYSDWLKTHPDANTLDRICAALCELCREPGWGQKKEGPKKRDVKVLTVNRPAGLKDDDEWRRLLDLFAIKPMTTAALMMYANRFTATELYEEIKKAPDSGPYVWSGGNLETLRARALAVVPAATSPAGPA